MKTNLLFKSILTLLLAFTVSIGYSQKVYEDYQDGKIWFKIKNSEENFIVKQASKSGNVETFNDENIKLSSMPFLRTISKSIFLSRFVKHLFN